ncbi:HD domain-containing protein [Tepidiforma sp.]|uniref:CCA tRNA nucleotidyltransferase n=1 Tax=Tepidiforma sp. TaxID=2682230 RepID=UPI00261857DE|nr:HD domain-containing protein [Tepidiforma sp.]MCX7618349.1 CCA tRNA nucleotidyltransferase [Tepidiforma sp.]
MEPTHAALREAFRARGRQLWLVGGALRDRLLGIASHDIDYATDALPDEVEAIARGLGARVTTVGKRFGTIGVLLEGEWVEITTFRGDSYAPGSRWPDVTFGRSIEEDLARRDFTITAFAENAHTGEWLDLFGGEADLRAGIIRAVGEPAARFREDPLRILRGVRFVSQLGFRLDPATAAGMRETAHLIAALSQERITAELDKLLQGRAPAAGLEALRDTGALPFALPELAGMPGCEQNRFHRFDVWGHTLATVDAIAVDPENRRIRRWAALLHDLGKPAVRHTKPNGEWGFYRHEVVGAELAEALLERLRFGRADAHVVVLLVRRHMERPDPADRRAVRRFMAKLGGRWRDLLALKRADNASHTYDDTAYHDALEAACLRAEQEEAEAIRAESPLSGDDLVRMFDRPPGPWIGVIKRQLGAMVLDGELAPGDRAAAERIARRLMGRG